MPLSSPAGCAYCGRQELALCSPFVRGQELLEALAHEQSHAYALEALLPLPSDSGTSHHPGFLPKRSRAQSPFSLVAIGGSADASNAVRSCDGDNMLDADNSGGGFGTEDAASTDCVVTITAGCGEDVSWRHGACKNGDGDDDSASGPVVLPNKIVCTPGSAMKAMRVRLQLGGANVAAPLTGKPFFPEISGVERERELGGNDIPGTTTDQSSVLTPHGERVEPCSQRVFHGPIVHEYCARQMSALRANLKQRVTRRKRLACVSAAAREVGGRVHPLGRDRAGRLFFPFPGDPSRICVLTSRGTAAWWPSNAEESLLAAAAVGEDGFQEKHDAKKWIIYEGPDDLRRLVGYLRPGGDEGELRAAIILRFPAAGYAPNTEATATQAAARPCAPADLVNASAPLSADAAFLVATSLPPPPPGFSTAAPATNDTAMTVAVAPVAGTVASTDAAVDSAGADDDDDMRSATALCVASSAAPVLSLPPVKALCNVAMASLAAISPAAAYSPVHAPGPLAPICADLPPGPPAAVVLLESGVESVLPPRRVCIEYDQAAAGMNIPVDEFGLGDQIAYGAVKLEKAAQPDNVTLVQCKACEPVGGGATYYAARVIDINGRPVDLSVLMGQQPEYDPESGLPAPDPAAAVASGQPGGGVRVWFRIFAIGGAATDPVYELISEEPYNDGVYYFETVAFRRPGTYILEFGGDVGAAAAAAAVAAAAAHAPGRGARVAAATMQAATAKMVAAGTPLRREAHTVTVLATRVLSGAAAALNGLSAARESRQRKRLRDRHEVVAQLKRRALEEHAPGLAMKANTAAEEEALPGDCDYTVLTPADFSLNDDPRNLDELEAMRAALLSIEAALPPGCRDDDASQAFMRLGGSRDKDAIALAASEMAQGGWGDATRNCWLKHLNETNSALGE